MVESLRAKPFLINSGFREARRGCGSDTATRGASAQILLGESQDVIVQVYQHFDLGCWSRSRDVAAIRRPKQRPSTGFLSMALVSGIIRPLVCKLSFSKGRQYRHADASIPVLDRVQASGLVATRLRALRASAPLDGSDVDLAAQACGVRAPTTGTVPQS